MKDSDERIDILESAPACDVCQKLLDAASVFLQRLSSSPGTLDDPADPHQLELGECSDLLFTKHPPSNCGAHGEFLLRSLGHRLERDNRVGIRQTRRGLTITCESTSSDGQTWVSWPGELLVLNETARKSEASGRKLDRKFIDPGLVRYWRLYCENHHGPECSQPQLRLSKPLAWLIDCEKKCLVAASDGDGICQYPYIALSYVWGQTPGLKTLRSNVLAQQKDGVFDLERLGDAIPRTIWDAIQLVPLLDERYLWVDSLCIVQDDPESLHSHIDQMATIFENAVLTIVAGDGPDADHGLPGIFQPRVLKPILKLSDDTSLAARQEEHLGGTVWATRGWTMQESIFSRRRIEFFDNSIRWSCQQNSYFEDVDSPLDLDRLWARTINSHSNPSDHICQSNISTDLPNMRIYFDLVEMYNTRKLTFDDDVLRAFDGTLDVLQQRAFPRGFLYGLPVSFLDVALVWRASGPFGKLEARSSRDPAHDEPPPSWTWAGWKGGIKYDIIAANYIKSVSEIHHGYNRSRLLVIPTLNWHLRTSPNPDTASPPVRIPFQNEWYQWKCQYMGQSENLPPGWKFHQQPEPDQEHVDALRQLQTPLYSPANKSDLQIPNSPNEWTTPYHYTHESLPDKIKFWHPVPLGNLNQSHQPPPNPPTPRYKYLSTQTQKARLSIARPRPNKTFLRHASTKSYEQIFPITSGIGLNTTTVLLNDHDQEIGTISIDQRQDSEQFMPEGINFREEPYAQVKIDDVGPVVPADIVAISRGIGFPAPYGMGHETYTFYNVLWVRWVDGVAYRRGIGHVGREAWEGLVKEDISLVLG